MPFATASTDKCLYLTGWTHKLWPQPSTDLTRRTVGQICLGGPSYYYHSAYNLQHIDTLTVCIPFGRDLSTSPDMVHLRLNMKRYSEQKVILLVFFWNWGEKGGNPLWRLETVKSYSITCVQPTPHKGLISNATPTLWCNTDPCLMQYSSNKMAGQRMREFGYKNFSKSEHFEN